MISTVEAAVEKLAKGRKKLKTQRREENRFAVPSFRGDGAVGVRVRFSSDAVGEAAFADLYKMGRMDGYRADDDSRPAIPPKERRPRAGEPANDERALGAGASRRDAP